MEAGPRKCRAIGKNGKPCRRPAGHFRDWCAFHDPEKQAEAAATRSAGGAAKQAAVIGYRDAYLDDAPAVGSKEEVRQLIATTIRDVLTGKLTPQRGTVVQNLCRAYLAVKTDEKQDEDLTDEELEVRLALELERVRARLAAKRAGSNGRGHAAAEKGA